MSKVQFHEIIVFFYQKTNVTTSYVHSSSKSICQHTISFKAEIAKHVAIRRIVSHSASSKNLDLRECRLNVTKTRDQVIAKGRHLIEVLDEMKSSAYQMYELPTKRIFVIKIRVLHNCDSSLLHGHRAVRRNRTLSITIGRASTTYRKFLKPFVSRFWARTVRYNLTCIRFE